MIQMHMQQGLSQDARIIWQEVFVEEQGFHHGKGAERMGLAYWIPFFIVVLGNIGYHEVAKATPVSAPPFLALSVTYLVSFLLCAAVYVVTGPSLRQDLSALNWASAAWGL